jgi:L-threonylcarbamoyladenylate synthase
VVDVAEAAAAIVRGEVVAYPTETFYGLAVDALNEAALAKLRALKGRDAEKTFSLLVSDHAMLASLCSEISPLAERMMAQYWPGPLTLALPARPGLPASIVANGYVAVRVSPHPIAQALVVAAGRPITATSANPAGSPPPRTVNEVAAHFPPPSCLILDGGTTPGGQPSTLARVRGERVEILRQGAVVVADGDVGVVTASSTQGRGGGRSRLS